VPEAAAQLGRQPDGVRAVALERVILFGAVPLLVVLLAFRDRPSRYGWTFGDDRAGAALAVAGCLVMTPIVIGFAGLPDVRAYYSVSAGPLPDVVLTNAIELIPAEFLFRGFLMFTLVRAIGPVGVLIAIMPFAFDHVGKPSLELLSTPLGGLAYGWLAWRTRSIVWGSIAHIYVMSLVTLAAASAAGSTATP
jgi:membrane protease YdiL (CAAX protease family)